MFIPQPKYLIFVVNAYIVLLLCQCHLHQKGNPESFSESSCLSGVIKIPHTGMPEANPSHCVSTACLLGDYESYQIDSISH